MTRNVDEIPFVTGEVGALLPVVATLLQFSPDEVLVEVYSCC